jgi:multisubunit Na+/H+ antiporter MnhB subunit
MKASWSKRRLAVTLVGGVGALILAASWYAYLHRRDRPTLFYYGATPELPGGTATVVLNPFRNRKTKRMRSG